MPYRIESLSEINKTGENRSTRRLRFDVSCRELASKAPDSKDILVKSFLYLISYSRSHSQTFTDIHSGMFFF